MQDKTPRTQTITDPLDPARAAALYATLDLAGTPPGTGDPLPPFFHQLYFWQALHPGDLGRDGHPRTGIGLIPDMGLPRRMWAGGTLEFVAPLRAGVAAEKTSSIEASHKKQGRSGPLGFVTLRHEIRQQGQLCLTELHDLVYRQDPAPDAPKPVPPMARTDEEKAEEALFNPTLLFRYSALTFNGHRIHYDRDYCRQVEGYDGLVVHGPLLAQYLMLMATRQIGPLRRFRFRATAPLIDTETATLCRKGRTLWVRGPDGRQCMEATADPA